MEHYLEIIDDIEAVDLLMEKKSRLLAMKAVKLYYCYYGRNAWHSTWSQKYTPNCMHFTFNSAKEFAERNRVAGSVFFIQEMPALQMTSAGKNFYITQINIDNPLKEYRLNSLKEDKVVDITKPKSYFYYGALIEKLMATFDPDSNFWTRCQGENSVLPLLGNVNVSPEDLGDEPLMRWKSKARGTGYYLDWNELDSEVSSKAIRDLNSKYTFSRDEKDLTMLANSELKQLYFKAKKLGYKDLTSYFNADEYEVSASFDTLFELRAIYLESQEDKFILKYISDLICTNVQAGSIKATMPNRLYELYEATVMVKVELWLSQTS